MIQSSCLKADIKQIIREPILVIFVFLPLFIYIVFKLLIYYLFPYIHSETGFNLSNYNNYILAVSFVMVPNMLGTVFGFLMLDERDNRITELMVVTPVGYLGYIFNRLFLPIAGCIIYTFLGYFILNIYPIPLIKLLIISVLIGAESILFGITLFTLADDKVKGLTYAKGLSLVMLFTLADLLNEQWVSFLASLFPFYWISKIVNSTNDLNGLLKSIAPAVFIHGIWLYVYFKLIKQRSSL